MKTSKPRVLIVGGRDSGVDWPGREDFELFLVQEHAHVSPRQAEIASVVEVGDLSFVDSYLPVLKKLHHDLRFAGVVSFFEKGLLPAAEIGELLDIPHNSRFSVETTRCKTDLRELLIGTSHEVPFALVRNDEAVRTFFRTHGCCIVKPVDGSGSVEIHKVESERFSLPTLNREFLAEKFLEGAEYSVETFTHDRRHRLLGVTKKYTTGASNFVETGHDFPADLPAEVQERIRDAVVWLLDRIGHVWGPCHTEVKVAEDGVHFIETQTRFGGDQIWEMVWRTTGVHLAAATVCALARRPYLPSPVEFSAMAVRFPQLPAGTDAVRLRDTLERQAFAIRAELKEVNFGTPFLSSSRRHGYVMFGCRSDDRAEFRAAIERDFLLNCKE
ncbi:ATP-grasp domain-containing protein [Xylophilus ampelinus]|uniref:ATP-grasp domain-containing protein n=1 Tax=Xylophilus ampelinus TaxID=54067 RepID=A0A318SRV1_9BURK|nr:ATP-grasp domain-containing protein [Xylophilus ampelinus]MCS4510900.1 ATP-grasp domain-containing protein [Xylophilus ampelinus]PYE76059.1 ATP-grasp domain-containing protein [Xylophilus ampelinus]